jgi:hypothetical protein
MVEGSTCLPGDVKVATVARESDCNGLHWYHGTRVRTMVRTRVRTRVRTMVHAYTYVYSYHGIAIPVVVFEIML